MLFSIAALAAFLFSGFTPAVFDQGGGVDPDGKPRAAARAASTDQGTGTDPDGRTRTARVAGPAYSDQGGATDPDGKPSR